MFIHLVSIFKALLCCINRGIWVFYGAKKWHRIEKKEKFIGKKVLFRSDFKTFKRFNFIFLCMLWQRFKLFAFVFVWNKVKWSKMSLTLKRKRKSKRKGYRYQHIPAQCFCLRPRHLPIFSPYFRYPVNVFYNEEIV